MKAIDRLKQHYDDLGMGSFEVPELPDENGDPMVIYFTPYTLGEQIKINNLANQKGGTRLLAWQVIVKALDKTGEPLFTIEDLDDLVKNVQCDLLATIAIKCISTPDPEDTRGN